MSTESNDPAIMDRINFYDEVQSEVYKIKDGDSKLSWDDLIEVFKK